MGLETERRAGDLGALTDGAMVGPWEWTRSRMPAGLETFDAHAHIGTDVDGRGMTAAGMKSRMQAANVQSAVVFPLNDPNARDDYSGPNDLVWSAHEEYPDAFVPFFRLNPHQDYEAEFDRCVGRGFVGLKLHPVSQSFELDDARVVRLFEMAASADLPVLIHAGFAMQRIIEPLLPTVERLPGLRLILGHAAMVELLAATRAFADHPNVLFETSVVKAKDLFVLFKSLDPVRICYGSDIPYGDLPSTLHATLGAADAAGLSDEELRGVFSGNLRRWFPAKEEPARRPVDETARVEPEPPGGEAATVEGAPLDLRVGHLTRLSGYLDYAILAMWQGHKRADVIMGMAQASVRGAGPGGPEGPEEELLVRLRALLQEAREHHAAGDFPAAMARMRVAEDLTALRVVRLARD